MTVNRNFLAGLASSGWTALAGLVAIPWYISYLGVEAYGMIGVHLTLQNLFVLLDLGLSPTVSREVARATAEGDRGRTQNLVRSMAIVFTVVGFSIALVLVLLSPWLATHWLNIGKLPPEQAVVALALSAVTVGARWPGTLFVGVLNGARRVDLASAITILTTTLSTLGAIAVLAFVEPSLRAFFLWQVLIGLLHSVLLGLASRRVLGTTAETRFEWAAIKSIWRFSAGMAGVATTGIMFSQIDKVVLMRTTSLDQVAHYTVATALAGILYRLVTPAFNVVFPELSALVYKGNRDVILASYLESTRRFLTLIFPVALILVVCARPILSLWLHKPDLVEQTSTLVILLTLGTAIHCAMYFPYALQLAFGTLKVPVVTNLLLSVVFLPSALILSWRYGAVGAATAWIGLHSLYLVLGTALTARFVMPGSGLLWLGRAVAPPLALATGFGLLAIAVREQLASDFAQLAVGGLFALAALGAGLHLNARGAKGINHS